MVDYDEFSVRCEEEVCEEVDFRFWSLVMDRWIDEYGMEGVKEVVEKLEEE